MMEYGLKRGNIMHRYLWIYSLLVLWIEIPCGNLEKVTNSYDILKSDGNVKLKYDEALLKVDSHVKTKQFIVIKGITERCYKCKLQEIKHGTKYVSAVINTRFPFKYELYIGQKSYTDMELACSETYHFGQHGHYEVNITKTPDEKYICTDIKTIKEPDKPLFALYAMGFALFVMAVIYNFVKIFWRKYRAAKLVGIRPYAPLASDPEASSRETSVSARYGSTFLTAPTPDNGKTMVPHRYRLRSLDTFRGISIILMIFVNYEGGKYWFINHSAWNGLSVADLVFPWFIFIMGTSIFISCRKLRRQRIDNFTISIKIVRRSIILFALGLFINNGFHLETWRIPGVLQRFAISYLVVALLTVWLSPDEDVVDTNWNYNWKDYFRDILWFPSQHVVIGLLLFFYLLIVFLIPAEGCPVGYFGPGGLSDNGKYYNCTGGITRYIDLQVFGIHHIYQHPTCKDIYKCLPYDPEGLLGIIPSIVLTYMGVQAARILFFYSGFENHVSRWLIWSAIWGFISLGLCGCSLNEGVIPVNKNLWSLSYVFATGSLAYLLLTFCYLMIDVKRYWSGVPFYFGGMNSILLYVGHEILKDYFPFNFQGEPQHDIILLRSVIGAMLWTFIAYICYKREFFVKI